MWDISEINQKKRQVIKQIKTCKNKILFKKDYSYFTVYKNKT